MSLFEHVAHVRLHLEQQGRVSFRAIKRECGVDDEDLEEIIEELVDIQRIAQREEKALAWVESTAAAVPASKPVRATPEPRSYTPKHLAEKILESRSALEGERKQVSVLFVDIKGSMDLAGQLDAEDWHRILDRFFAILSEAVHRFEGTINQYTGDGIMALFGAPIAHEDHAQRACYAALQMREHLRRFSLDLRMEQGLDFGVRVGINSGDDLRMDYTAQGQTVGIAQRLEQLAESGHAYISEHTARLVQGYFQVTDLGASKLSASGSPVTVFDLNDSTQARTRLQVSRARGLTQFVGRDNEMHLLESALERAQAGHGQVVGVVGEPGLGKSRLCFEFTEQCRARGIAVYEAHCPSHGKSIPFVPILELFRNYFDISDRDSPAQARQKIAGALVLLDASLHESLPVLFELLGVGDGDNPAPNMDADARKRQLFDMLHKVIRAQSARGVAAVTFIDDMHWIDDWSNEYVAQMVEALEQSHGLLLINFRPEYQASWNGRAHYQQLPLVPLGREAVQELVEILLGDDDSVTELAQKIMDWTGGNPLYSEEVINTLIETGQLQGKRGAYRLNRPVELLEVPLSVQAIIAARIDRIDDNAKRVLQTASVVGKDFSKTIIARISEIDEDELTSALERLKATDFLFETALYPVIEYSFKHPLVHEVAYESQLREHRSLRHAAVATALESVEAERLDEYASMLAYHWERAGEAEQAIKWHRKAAAVASSNDPASAMQHWLKVRTLFDQVEPTVEVLNIGAEACGQLSNLGWRLGSTEGFAQTYFEDGLALADRAGNTYFKAVLNGSYAAMRGIAHGYANDYTSFGQDAVRLADQTDDRALQTAQRNWVVFGMFFSGRLQEARTLARETLENYPHTGSDPSVLIGVDCLWSLSMADAVTSALLGKTDEFQELFALSRERCGNDPELNAFNDGMESMVANVFGRFDQALMFAHRGIDGAETKGTAYSRCITRHALSLGLLNQDEFQRAAEIADETLSIMEEQNTGRAHLGGVAGVLSLAELALGNVDAARSRSGETIVFCHERTQYWELSAWVASARSCIALGDQEAALAVMMEMDELVERTGAVGQRPNLHINRALFAREFSSEWHPDVEFEMAREAYVALGAHGHIARLERFDDRRIFV